MAPAGLLPGSSCLAGSASTCLTSLLWDVSLDCVVLPGALWGGLAARFRWRLPFGCSVFYSDRPLAVVADKSFTRSLLLAMASRLVAESPLWSQSVTGIMSEMKGWLCHHIGQERAGGRVPKGYMDLLQDLTRLGQHAGKLLPVDITFVAAQLTERPTLVLTLPGDHKGLPQDFDLSAVMYGDYRPALSPAGLAAEDVSLFVLSGSHYSFLLPTTDVHLGYEPKFIEEDAFSDSKFTFDGHFTLLRAGCQMARSIICDASAFYDRMCSWWVAGFQSSWQGR